MRITRLSLENFRSFGSRQTIEFAPLTMFLGPNSVGKSNALLALSYVQHILETGDCNPNYIEKFGTKLLGGFQGLVHKRDLTKEIRISIEFDKENQIGKTYSYLRDFVSMEDFDTVSQISDAKVININLEIAWSKATNSAYVKFYSAKIDNQLVFTATSDPKGKKPEIESVNFFHPLFVPSHAQSEVEECHQAVLSVRENHKNNKRKNVANPAEIIEFGGNLDETGFLYPLHYKLSLNKSNVGYVYQPDNQLVRTQPQISFANSNGALPVLNRQIVTGIIIDDEQEQLLSNELLSDIVVAPLDNLLQLLQSSLHIGPLRHIETSLIGSTKRVNTNWYDGSAAWPELMSQSSHVIKAVDGWMSDSSKLNLGIGIKARLRLINDSIHSVDAEFESFDFLTHSTVKRIHQISEALWAEEDSTFQFLDRLKEYLDDNGIDSSSLDFLSDSMSMEDEYEALVRERLDDFLDILDPNHLMSFVLSLVKDFSQKPNTSRNASLALQEVIGDLGFCKLDYTLWDLNSDIAVEPSDIGVGLSQLKPLVIAANLPNKKLISIEQPELHVHPRIQTSTADLLIKCSKNTTFMVETHSEHLLLRLRKRIRQTTDNELPSSDYAVLPEQVSIIYFETSEEGVKVKRIRVDEDGEFLDKWPHGFFSERREELM